MESNPVTGCTLDKFELTVRSRKETSTINVPENGIVDLKPYVGEIHYFESLLSPITTATVLIVNRDPNLKLYEDLGFADGGGEKVELLISDVVSHYTSQYPGLPMRMYVAQVSNRESTAIGEVFTLKLESTWKETQENAKKIKGEREGNPLTIAQEVYKANFGIEIPKENTTQPTNSVRINFGGEKKDDTLPSIMRLASMSEKDNSAGFFFWQNKFGHFYRDINTLVEEGKDLAKSQDLAPYVYGGVNEGILNNELNARTIRTINGKTNHFVVKQNARAAGPVVNVGFDPITYNFYQETKFTQEDDFKVFDEALVTIDDESLSTANAWGNSKLDNLGFIYRNPDNICTYAEQPFKSKAKAKARYTSFFGRMVTINVPANTNIVAGGTLRIEILRKQQGAECNTEDNIVTTDDSGLYTVAAVCHAFSFGVPKAYSSVLLSRDQKKRKKQQ